MTELTDFQRIFSAFLPEIVCNFAEPMAKHTSFRIGGPAEVMAFPQSAEELSAILKFCRKQNVQPAVLGAGTNILAPDAGIKGLVICLKDALDGIRQTGECTISVAAGVTMSRTAVFAANHNLSGLEFAHGIPGSVGGGVYMNAGAYGGEICNVCRSVQVMDMDGNLLSYPADRMEFSYRHSILEEKGGIVVSAEFQLTPKPADEIRTVMQDLMNRRKNSQPLDMPSAGSAFKRPVGGYASALIDQAGLRGFQVGNAAISQKHTGFAVNLGNATAEDVKSLLRTVSDKVFENSGIRLEPEVRIW